MVNLDVMKAYEDDMMLLDGPHKSVEYLSILLYNVTIIISQQSSLIYVNSDDYAVF